MERVFRLCDFNVYNESPDASSSDEDAAKSDKNVFVIQMFGITETGETCSIIAQEFKPFFYVKVPEKWTSISKNDFLEHVKNKMGKFYAASICDCKIIKRKNLYGFDGGMDHKFIMFKFNNVPAFNKAKNIWYHNVTNKDGEQEHKLLPHGYKYQNAYIHLYEANIPPLLRFFHINEISPSGWVSIPSDKGLLIPEHSKTTTCKYEFKIDYKYITALNDKETRVPYKICSFDIEASSSHGDFPLPVKSYKKLATNIVDYFSKLESVDLTPVLCKNILKRIILCAFDYDSSMSTEIDIVYPKKAVTKDELKKIPERAYFLNKSPFIAKNSSFLFYDLKPHTFV